MKLYDITKGVNIDRKRLSSRTEQTHIKILEYLDEGKPAEFIKEYCVEIERRKTNWKPNDFL